MRSVSLLMPRSCFFSLDDDLEGVDVVLVDGLEAEDDVAVHLDEAAVGVVDEARVAGLRHEGGRLATRAAAVLSLRPRLRMVSIIPGMEARAPERTETSRGLLGSPNA